MKDKFEVKNVFQDIYKMIDNQFHSKISIFRADNGKEYFNEYLGNFLGKKVFFINLYVVTLLNKMVLPKQKIRIY